MIAATLALPGLHGWAQTGTPFVLRVSATSLFGATQMVRGRGIGIAARTTEYH